MGLKGDVDEVLATAPPSILADWVPSEETAVQPSIKEKFDIYEAGKHRRYSLLFSVNGGAFAIGKLLSEPCKHDEQCARVFLGALTVSELAVGMVFFTAIMIADIYEFGEKMRNRPYYLRDAFLFPGKVVLLLLGALLCMGWAIASGITSHFNWGDLNWWGVLLASVYGLTAYGLVIALFRWRDVRNWMKARRDRRALSSKE